MAEKRVLLSRPLPPPAATLLAEAGLAVEQPEHDGALSRPDFLQRVHGVAALVTMLSERVDDELLAAAGPSLKIVANYAVGFDNIDVPACTRRGIRVTNTPGVLTDATADLAWALILAAARRVVEGDRLVRQGRWQGWGPSQLLGMQLTGATLGLLGAGRIGTAVGLRSAGFRMRVLYADPRRNEELEREVRAEWVDLDRLLAESDVLSLHIPMSPECRHLFGAAQFARMKRSAILINTARGPLLDEAALVTALRERVIAAAGLDVYEHEPKLAPGLAELPNVVLLPHLGSATDATRERMSQMVAENVLAVLAGREPPNPVNALK